ncbi:3',5'-cyclic-nucleotide phosphodiesterase [Oleoguttula sp. CCFEE 5521]
MEEAADGRCRVVYYCTSAGEHVSAVHHWKDPPARSEGSGEEDAPRAVADANVRILLDEDQGGLHEVFMSSSSRECWERIEQYAGSTPTVVLLESQQMQSGKGADEDPAIAFLRSLATDVQGARYQHHVIPFVILPAASSNAIVVSPTSEAATDYLNAGAVETLRSPLKSEDLSRLVGHVKEEIRPRADLIGVTMARNLADSIRDTSSPGKPSHRPDKTTSPARLRHINSAVQEWDFPAHEMSMDELTCAALFMIEHVLESPELAEYKISRSEIMGLLLATRRQYKHEREVHYHNWRHAVDVTQSIYIFLVYIGACPPVELSTQRTTQRTSLEQVLTPLDALILLVSAIGHDVGHPGVNNAFLVACSHPLAQLYNDKSVLENYHCAAYTQLLRRHWPSLTKIPNFRSSMISNILATDMQRHFEYMATLGELKTKHANGKQSLDQWSDKDREHARELMMALLMKAADISNVARPFAVSSQWAKVLISEFARQGELEQELGIPTCLFGGPPNKDDVLSAAQSQKGFMNLFGFPLFQGISEIIPSVACSVETLQANQATWEQKIQEEKQRRGPEGKNAPLTFSSVGRTEINKAETMHHRSEPAVMPLPSAPSSPSKRDHNPTAASRRSSKDVALEHMHSFPSSRRGSKDESLTTILVRSHATSNATQPSSTTTSADTKLAGESEGRGPPAVPSSPTAGGLRESRSRSRLRGLKFWRKKSGLGGERGSESP